MSSAAVIRPPTNLAMYNDGSDMVSMSGMLAFKADTRLEESSQNILINTIQLVEPHSRMPIPNHLLQTKLFTTIGQNKIIQARPNVLNFAGFEVGKVYRLKLLLVNASNDVQRVHIIPPQTNYFSIGYSKQLKMVPGTAVKCNIEFCPDQFRYYYDYIRIHGKSEENLIIPIHAYPVLDTSVFPKLIDFSLVPVGELKTRAFTLKSLHPLDLDFRISFAQVHPFFTVEPAAGVLQAGEEVKVCVSFEPTAFQTAYAKLQLQVLQFRMKPLVCQLLGRSIPGLAHDTFQKSESDHLSLQTNHATSTLDPTLVSPLSRARSRKAKLSSSSASAEKAVDLRQGLILPTNLNSPHAVSYVLGQKTGKLKTAHFRQASHPKNAHVQLMTREMKSAQFETALRQIVYDESQNQIRWQVKLGDDLPLPEFQVKVIDCRLGDWKIYKRLRGDTNPDDEFERKSSDVIMRRTCRTTSESVSHDANFDVYSNNTWAARWSALNRFQQAVRKHIIRQRMIARLRALQRYLTATAAAPTLIASECASEQFLNASRVSSVTFPIYVSPSDKDDLVRNIQTPSQLFLQQFGKNIGATRGGQEELGCPRSKRGDVVGPVKTALNVLHSVTPLPFHPLQVPQYSHLYGYDRFDVQQAAMSYTKPVSFSLLRSVPKQTEPAVVSAPVSTLTEPATTAINQTADVVQPVGDASAGLCPPAALFKPIRCSTMQIFNPVPGLITMLTPLPDCHSNTCPLGRFVTTDDPNDQQQLLDRQDIIKGAMTWKKLASHAIASTVKTPSLTNVWVPRWNDPFNDELLPSNVPQLKSGLDKDDELCCSAVEDSWSVQLTMDMVKAEFASLASEYAHEEMAASEPVSIGAKKGTADAKIVQPVVNNGSQSLLGNKLPTTNLPASDMGPIPRVSRQSEFVSFIRRKNNILGSKIQSRKDAANRLKKNPSMN